MMTAKGLSVTPLSTFYRKYAGVPPVLGHFSDGSIGHKTSGTIATSGRFPRNPRQSRRREAECVPVAGVGAVLGLKITKATDRCYVASIWHQHVSALVAECYEENAWGLPRAWIGLECAILRPIRHQPRLVCPREA